MYIHTYICTCCTVAVICVRNTSHVRLLWWPRPCTSDADKVYNMIPLHVCMYVRVCAYMCVCVCVRVCAWVYCARVCVELDPIVVTSLNDVWFRHASYCIVASRESCWNFMPFSFINIHVSDWRMKRNRRLIDGLSLYLVVSSIVVLKNKIHSSSIRFI